VFGRRRIKAAGSRGLWALVVLAAALAASCGGVVMIASAAGKRYATTPTSAGAIRLRAIPLGDGYVSTSPRVGYVDSCITHFSGGVGAQAVGPWIDTTTKTWDYSTKIAVNGAISWPSGAYKLAVVGSRRVIRFNDLPVGHTSGVFPIASTDPAYKYDHNPNRLQAQSFDWRLPLNPKTARKPGCTPGGPIGVLKDGVVLFNALDGEGRDAAAHEVLDLCAAHPDGDDIYHHHDIPPCILDKTPNGRSTLVGYALDGYGIYVQKNAHGQLPTNVQLDACHGTTSRVLWNGRMTRVYHYVATLEYPYTVGCFHGTAISSGAKSGSRGGGASGPPGAAHRPKPLGRGIVGR
jgi:YHYH protein